MFRVNVVNRCWLGFCSSHLNMIKYAGRIFFVNLHMEMEKMVSRISNQKKYVKWSNYAKN